MAYPKRVITGKVYSPRGDVVTAGKVFAILVPENAIVPDTAGGAVYKVGGPSFSGDLLSSGVQSFALTRLDSVVPSTAYYRVLFRIDEPESDDWEECWRITGSGDLPIEEITPL